MDRPCKIAVLGLGAVGGALAALLSRSGQTVISLVKPERVQSLRTSGITFDSKTFGNFVAHPFVSQKLDDAVDLLVVATKFYDLDAALERVNSKYLQNAIILPLLNGSDHMQKMRQRFGASLVAGSVSVVAEKDAQGVIHVFSSFFEVSMGCDDKNTKLLLNEWGPVFETAGITVNIKNSEAGVIWGKLARLSALACLTAYADAPIGVVRDDQGLRSLLEDFLRETVMIAGAEGVNLDYSEHLEILNKLSPDATSSMHRDMAAGRPSEIDAIGGAVVRAARRHGLECPTVFHIVGALMTRNKKAQ